MNRQQRNQSKDEIYYVLAACRIPFLSEIFERCARRLIEAAWLLEIRSVLDAVRQVRSSGRFDVGPLFPVYDVIQTRYIEELHSGQLDMFDEDYRQTCIRRWKDFAYNYLLPALVGDAEFVRNLMRAMAVLPYEAPANPVRALCQHVREIDLPDILPTETNEEDL